MSDPAPSAKLLPEAPLLVLPTLATAVGLNEAIVLQQVHFRTRGGGWWRATVPELRAEFPFWHDATVKRTLGKLRESGLVKVRKDGTDRANQYQLDYGALESQIAPIDGRRLASDCADPSAQSAPVSYIGSKRNGNDKREEGSRRRFSRFDQAEQR